MHIFIDESGTFSGTSDKSSVSAVGSLVIPDQNMGGFEKLYSRVRRNLPMDKGEVKGRLLSEAQVGLVVELLNKINCLFELVAVDSLFHTNNEIAFHKFTQAEKITENLTDSHHQTLIEQVWNLRRRLERMPLQLYVQSVAMSELVYNTIYHANLYYSFRLPKELGGYRWIIDAKDRDKVTSWEDWWSKVVLPIMESKSFRQPFVAAEGGDYRWHERFRTEPSEFKRQFVNDPERGQYFDLKPILQENFRFSSAPEYGLEAVDILVNAVRRSMAGNFRREGWLPIRKLMVHWGQHYIRMISLAVGERSPPSVPYAKLLSDFSTGGRAMLPPSWR